MADDDSTEEIGPRVPSSASSDYGRPFAEIFQRYDEISTGSIRCCSARRIVTFCNRRYRASIIEFGQFAPDVLAESFAKK